LVWGEWILAKWKNHRRRWRANAYIKKYLKKVRLFLLYRAGLIIRKGSNGAAAVVAPFFPSNIWDTWDLPSFLILTGKYFKLRKWILKYIDILMVASNPYTFWNIIQLFLSQLAIQHAIQTSHSTWGFCFSLHDILFQIYILYLSQSNHFTCF